MAAATVAVIFSAGVELVESIVVVIDDVVGCSEICVVVVGALPSVVMVVVIDDVVGCSEICVVVVGALPSVVMVVVVWMVVVLGSLVNGICSPPKY